MTRKTKQAIYDHELAILLDAGVEYGEADRIAKEQAEYLYWSFVDEAHQQAKDDQYDYDVERRDGWAVGD